MSKSNTSNFLFYLTVEENLPRSFFILNQAMKTYGFVLVPVRVDQIQQLVSISEQSHIMIISSVSQHSELKSYNQKIRGILKYILKSKRISFLLLSSYSVINDTKMHTLTGNFYFIKFPLVVNKLAQVLVKFYESKILASHKWPGGKKSGVRLIT